MSETAGGHGHGGAGEILRRLWPLVALAAIIAVIAVAASFARDFNIFGDESLGESTNFRMNRHRGG